MDKVLEVKDMTKIYHNKRGVRGISFDIYRGEIYGLLGPNGAGKTTIMKVITGLCRPNSGQVKIFGYNVADQFELALAKVGAIIETADAYDYLSGYKNLELALRFYPDLNKRRIDEVLTIVGLRPYANEQVKNYSLGMRQRLALASAILSHPEFIILDEPMNGLDIEGMVDIRKLIVGLAREQGVSFLISSHLAHEMELTCQRVGIINHGQLICEGVVTDLMQKYPSLEEYFIEQTKTGRGRSVDESLNS